MRDCMYVTCDEILNEPDISKTNHFSTAQSAMIDQHKNR